jgi:hypothetical protein
MSSVESSNKMLSVSVNDGGDVHAERQYMEVLHGQTKHDGSSFFFTKVTQKNYDLHKEAVEDYNNFFQADRERANRGEDIEGNQQERLSKYTRLTNTYYNLVTDLYEVRSHIEYILLFF